MSNLSSSAGSSTTTILSQCSRQSSLYELNVDATAKTICRLERALRAQQHELKQLEQTTRFNQELNLDQDLQSGKSLATLHIHVLSAVNLVYNKSFFAGKKCYVVASLEPKEASEHPSGSDKQMTSKHKTIAEPTWNETFVFYSVKMVYACVQVVLYQEEMFGADKVIASGLIPLQQFHQQRSQVVKWFELKASRPSQSAIQLGVFLQRTRLQPLRMQIEQLKQQIADYRKHLSIELHTRPDAVRESSSPASPPPPPPQQQQLEEHQSSESQLNASTTWLTSVLRPLTIANAAEPVRPAANRSRKREYQDATHHHLHHRFGSTRHTESNVGGPPEVHHHRSKRQRRLSSVESASEVDHLIQRLANWLLPK